MRWLLFAALGRWLRGRRDKMSPRSTAVPILGLEGLEERALLTATPWFGAQNILLIPFNPAQTVLLSPGHSPTADSSTVGDLRAVPPVLDPFFLGSPGWQSALQHLTALTGRLGDPTQAVPRPTPTRWLAALLADVQSSHGTFPPATTPKPAGDKLGALLLSDFPGRTTTPGSQKDSFPVFFIVLGAPVPSTHGLPTGLLNLTSASSSPFTSGYPVLLLTPGTDWLSGANPVPAVTWSLMPMTGLTGVASLNHLWIGSGLQVFFGPTQGAGPTDTATSSAAEDLKVDTQDLIASLFGSQDATTPPPIGKVSAPATPNSSNNTLAVPAPAPARQEQTAPAAPKPGTASSDSSPSTGAGTKASSQSTGEGKPAETVDRALAGLTTDAPTGLAGTATHAEAGEAEGASPVPPTASEVSSVSNSSQASSVVVEPAAAAPNERPAVPGPASVAPRSGQAGTVVARPGLPFLGAWVEAVTTARVSQPERTAADEAAWNWFQAPDLRRSVSSSPLEEGPLPSAPTADDSAPETKARSLLDLGRLMIPAVFLGHLPGTGPAQAEASSAEAAPVPGDTRLLVADLIQHSAAAFTTLVCGFYDMFLGRGPAQGEEQGWVLQLLQGKTEEQVLGAFLSTPEFHKRARTLVPACTPDEAFIRALYLVLLVRAATEAELSGWLSALPSLGRGGVAAFLLASAEFRRRQVEEFFCRLLRRKGTPDEVDAWVSSPFDLGTVCRLLESQARQAQVG